MCRNHQAPGEAEAELARLNQARIVDAVMTDDSDALVFGATHVIRGLVMSNTGESSSRTFDLQVVGTE
jgi:5'-3' exonuclease